jgi:nicotinamidase-related amidase
VQITSGDTALVLTDPQNDFLSPEGVTWELVGSSVEENGTVQHIEQLLAAAKQAGTPVFVSPHYYFPHDHEWGFGGTIEQKMHVICSPHKVYGPEQNDLVLQLRKRGISKVVLTGMSANLCIESHLRELLEQGFQVAVVADATAAAQHPELRDGYAAALTKFRYIAGAFLTTDETVQALAA